MTMIYIISRNKFMKVLAIFLQFFLDLGGMRLHIKKCT